MGFDIFLEFEKYSIPEDLIPLSDLALPGLAWFPRTPHFYEEEKYEAFTELSPIKMPKCAGTLFLTICYTQSIVK